jgi:CDP-diglyceride synthetase
MPSPTARVSGAMLAMITAVVAMVVLWNGFAAESAGEAIPRVVGGLLLVLLVVVLAMLSLAPEIVVRLFARRTRA